MEEGLLALAGIMEKTMLTLEILLEAEEGKINSPASPFVLFLNFLLVLPMTISSWKAVGKGVGKFYLHGRVQNKFWNKQVNNLYSELNKENYLGHSLST